jgi:malate dehydrogenase (oxaloacetate-decarboxylating)
MKSKALEYSKQPKLGIKILAPMETRDDLSLAYTPGIAEVSQLVAQSPEKLKDYSFRRNNLAVISDGSAVLGLGNIGHLASYPVMEGKSMLFKRFADIDAVPIIIRTQKVDEFVNTVIQIADSFAAINLEDISAPRCFEIEERLKNKLFMPVMHDDQHGTAVVVLAALKNALKITNKNKAVRIVVSGSGAAGVAITKMLINAGFTELTMVDSKGIIDKSRGDLDQIKQELAVITNPSHISGSLADALVGANVFIGVSKGGVLTPNLITKMAPDPIVIAMANPIPEIMPNLAQEAGAVIVATGRSDFPNQVNNALAFPGIFRGAIDANSIIGEKCKLAAAEAIVKYHSNDLSINNLMPQILDPKIHQYIAKEVYNMCSSISE